MEVYFSVNFIIANDFKISSTGNVIHFILTCPGIFDSAAFGFKFSEINFTFYIAKHKRPLIVWFKLKITWTLFIDKIQIPLFHFNNFPFAENFLNSVVFIVEYSYLSL